jgi:hypothetical protein
MLSTRDDGVCDGTFVEKIRFFDLIEFDVVTELIELIPPVEFYTKTRI